MSTENEGAAVPPEAEPQAPAGAQGSAAPASGAQAPHTPQDAPPPPAFAPVAGSAPAPKQLPSAGASDGALLPASAGADTGALPPAATGADAGAQPTSGAGSGPGSAPGPQGGGSSSGWSQDPQHTAAFPPVPPGGGGPHDAGAPYGGGAGGWGGPPQPPYGGGGWGAPAGHPAQGPRRRGGLIAAVLVAALVAGGVGGGIGYWAAGQDDTASTTVSASGDPQALNRKPTSVSGIAQRALPSVVTIDAQGAGGEGGTGTGFVYDKQGHILTNNHVVASAADGGKLTVTFSNGKKYAAEVVGRAQGYDVAVIKLKNPDDATLTPLPLGKSANVAVGDATIAIGAPYGLSGTVTTGIVSAKGRPVASSDGGGTNASYMSALQTDASINPGNSGGPLMDASGNVIGINSAIQSAGSGGGSDPFGGEGQSGSIGLGFAIPIDQAKRVADDLIRTGKPVYPQIGVQVGMRETSDGATIAQRGNGGTAAVTPNGPADKAGLKPGDKITKLDDTVIDSGPTLISEIWQHRPGDKVSLTYERAGKQHTTKVTLGQRVGDS
ncbi:S1C family serine protease [Streptomyces ochraceiscleroticus]|uniref:Trypsin-like peptidase domain-containing protein n=1 Tax=Streptomyces ochraceiscleroticus TaxID=47761 RepID=A0ABW1MNE1_9ACTN|nr:trypsin-like peptidase domain-containing protein [Streptomyces ochraceiscleroticus]